jgi:hypothetical protein
VLLPLPLGATVAAASASDVLGTFSSSFASLEIVSSMLMFALEAVPHSSFAVEAVILLLRQAFKLFLRVILLQLLLKLFAAVKTVPPSALVGP